MQLGAAGVVTDGALRDTPAIRRLDIPVYHGSSHAATLSRLHMPLDHQIPIACAGVTVMPGDVIVGDEEGAVVIPAALVEEVAADAVPAGVGGGMGVRASSPPATARSASFPLSDKRRPEFEAWLAAASARPSKQEA